MYGIFNIVVLSWINVGRYCIQEHMGKDAYMPFLYVHVHHRSTICAFNLWLQGVKTACVVDVRYGLLVYCAWFWLHIYIIILYTLYREPIIATCHFNLKVWHGPKSARMFWYTPFFAKKENNDSCLTSLDVMVAQEMKISMCDDWVWLSIILAF